MTKPPSFPAASPIAAHLLAGRAAEAAAARFLEQHGLVILARNLRVAGGEIDLLARDGAALVFCEVRWRAGSGFGGALASIDARKRARMWRAAQSFLCRLRNAPPARLDALCAQGPAPYAWQWLRGI